MAFYTFLEQVGNRIFHKYIDSKGNFKTEIIKEFPISLFVKTKDIKKASSKSLYGDSLVSVDFNSISDARDFVREYQDIQEIYRTNISIISIYFTSIFRYYFIRFF